MAKRFFLSGLIHSAETTDIWSTGRDFLGDKARRHQQLLVSLRSRPITTNYRQRLERRLSTAQIFTFVADRRVNIYPTVNLRKARRGDVYSCKRQSFEYGVEYEAKSTNNQQKQTVDRTVCPCLWSLHSHSVGASTSTNPNLLTLLHTAKNQTFVLSCNVSKT